jgi:hypothetical protein
MSGATSSEPGRIALQLNTAVPSPARLGGMALGFGRLKGRVPTGSRWLVPGLGVEMKLSLTAFHRCQAVIDYPARQLTLAAPALYVETARPDRQVHTLVFDRKGQRFIVTARVERFM